MEIILYERRQSRRILIEISNIDIEPSRAVNPNKIIMARISRIERMINIINNAYKMGYKFDYDELAKYQEEAIKILTNADIDANDSITKEALIANLIEITDNDLEDEIYVLTDVDCEAEDYLTAHAPVYDYDLVEVSRQNHPGFIWCDGHGYEFRVDGQFISDPLREPRYFRNNGEWIKKQWFEIEDVEKEDGVIFIEKHCDSLGRVIQLYCYWNY